jgi:uncharacterized protein YndB with AHSA1/START domain
LNIRKTTEGPVGAGTVYEAQEKIGAKFSSLSKITVYEPNRRIAWLSTPSAARNTPDERWHMWTFTLQPENSGTRLTQEIRAAKAPLPMRIVQLIAILTSGGTKTLTEGMEKTLQNVKERAERSAVAST